MGIEYTSNLLLPGNAVVKRALDVLLGGIMLVAALPVIVVACLLVKLVSPGSAFFTQRRTARAGHSIRVPKIRTMRSGSEEDLARHLHEDAELAAEWQRYRKLRRDPRLVPFFGRLLRKFSIDELPQLWSVVRGDMSLVGPRPFPDDHLALFSPSFRALRERVRPGITGLWQVTIRSEGNLEDQQALDTYYIRNWSPWLDLYVLGRTFGAVLSGRGAF